MRDGRSFREREPQVVPQRRGAWLTRLVIYLSDKKSENAKLNTEDFLNPALHVLP